MKHIDILTEKSRISSNIDIKKVLIYNAMLKFQFALKKRNIVIFDFSSNLFILGDHLVWEIIM